MSRTTAGKLLFLFFSLLMALAGNGQWNNHCNQDDQQPKYALLGLSDGRIALVRFSDWAVCIFGESLGRYAAVDGIVYYCGYQKAIAVIILETSFENPAEVAYLDLIKGRIRFYQTKDIPGAGRNILYESLQPSGLLVWSSDKLRYYDDYKLEGNNLIVKNRLDIATGQWSMCPNNVDQASALAIPAGKQFVPSVSLRLHEKVRDEPAEARDALLFDREMQVQKELASRMIRQGLIKRNDYSSRFDAAADALLYAGEGYQLIRAAGKLLLTEASSNGFKVICTSPKDFGQGDKLLLTPDATALIADDLPFFK